MNVDPSRSWHLSISERFWTGLENWMVGSTKTDIAVLCRVVIDSAYYSCMVSPSMDSITIHGWRAPLVVKSSNETYGMIPPKSLPSMDISSIHGWKISMSGMQYLHHSQNIRRQNDGRIVPRTRSKSHARMISFHQIAPLTSLKT